MQHSSVCALYTFSILSILLRAPDCLHNRHDGRVEKWNFRVWVWSWELTKSFLSLSRCFQPIVVRRVRVSEVKSVGCKNPILHWSWTINWTWGKINQWESICHMRKGSGVIYVVTPPRWLGTTSPKVCCKRPVLPIYHKSSRMWASFDIMMLRFLFCRPRAASRWCHSSW